MERRLKRRVMGWWRALSSSSVCWVRSTPIKLWPLGWIQKYSSSARYALDPDNAIELNLVPILDQPTVLEIAQALGVFNHGKEVRRNIGGDIKREVEIPNEGERFSLSTPVMKIGAKMEEMGVDVGEEREGASGGGGDFLKKCEVFETSGAWMP